MIAGPSEILVVAEAEADPDWVAADLLSPGRARRARAGDPDHRRRGLRATPWWPRSSASWRGCRAATIAAASWRAARRHDRWSRRIEDAAGLVDALAPEHLELIGPRAEALAGRDPPCRRDLPRAVHARGDRRLCRRAEPRAADRPHRALLLGPRRLRLPEAHHAAGLRPRRLRGAGAGRGARWPGPRGWRRTRWRSSAARGCRHERRARPASSALELDQKSIVRWSPEVEHEREVAIFDLLEDNHFRPGRRFPGPYRVCCRCARATLVHSSVAGGGRRTPRRGGAVARGRSAGSSRTIS